MELKIERTGNIFSIAATEYMVTFPDGTQENIWSGPWNDYDDEEDLDEDDIEELAEEFDDDDEADDETDQEDEE